MRYIGIDGDNIGAHLELLLLQNNEDGIQSFSQNVDQIIEYMAELADQLNMKIIFFSGDSLLCKGEDKNIPMFINEFIRKTEKIKFSVGIGHTLRDTYLALKYAKVSGKNRIVILENDNYLMWDKCKSLFG